LLIWRKTHAITIMTKCGRHADKGRNACVAAQRVFVTPVRRNTAKYTPRGTVLKGPPGRKNHIMTPEERLECYQLYSKWIKEGRMKGESPIPSLKRKYKACRHKSFFSRLVQRQFETGTINPPKPTGRRAVYDKDQIAPLIKQCVDDARELQTVADAPFIRRYLLEKGISPCPSERWIIDHKKERGVKAIKIKFKPKLKSVMMKDRQESAEIIIDLRRVDVPGREDARLERRRRGCVPVHEARGRQAGGGARRATRSSRV